MALNPAPPSPDRPAQFRAESLAYAAPPDRGVDWAHVERSRLLRRVLPWLGAIIVAGAAVTIVSTLLTPAAWQLWTMLALWVAGMTAFVWAVRWHRRGRSELSSYILVAILCVVSLAMAALFDNLLVPLGVIAFLIGLLAGVLISTWAGILSALSVVCVGLLLFAVGQAGLLHYTMRIEQRIVDILDVTIYLLTVSLGMYLVSLNQKGTRQAIGRFLRQSDELQAANQRLEQEIAERNRIDQKLARANEDLAQQNARLRTLYQIGQMVNSTLEPDAILDRLVNEVMRVTRATHGQVLVVQEKEGAFERRSLHGFSPDEAQRARSRPLPLDQGINGRAYQTRRAAYVQDVQVDPEYYALIPSTRSELAIPVMREQLVLGNLDLQSPESAAFDDVDLDYVNALAGQVAIALTNAQIYQAVERARRDWEVTFSAMYDPVALLDRDKCVIQANQAFHEMIGTSQSVMGQPYATLMMDERCRVPSCPLNLALSSGLSAMCVHGYHGRIFECQVIPVEEQEDPEAHTSSRMLYAMHDITERERAEAELASLAAVIEQATETIMITDLEGNLVYVNPAFETSTGYKTSEVLGKNPRILKSGRHDPEFYADLWSTLTAGQTWEGVLIDRRQDGTIYYEEATIFPIRESSGRMINYAAVKRDVTERIRAAQELERAKEAAEAAARTKSEFLANMSHEIRTPLNAVIGMTSLLLDTELTGEQQEFAETVRDSGEALLTIINDILDFSKIESGKLALEHQPFDLRECIEGALDLVVPQAAEKNLDLAYIVQDTTPNALIGDVTRLRQILANLLSNAVKFTERGEVVVSVTSSELTREQHELHFAVRDTGIGIPQDRIDLLFQSFSQVDSSMTRQYGGTGLGLAISRQLCEMMGGRIWVQSKEEEGSTFHFTILAEPAPSQLRMYQRGTHPELAGKRVLIVDDNATNRRILVHQTTSWGMLPHATSSGRKALDWVGRGDPFDVAILDMHMPGMDGWTLAAEIRKQRSAQEMPLIMLTSVGTRPSDEHAEFEAFLNKPIKASLLYDALLRVVASQPDTPQRQIPRLHIDPQMGNRHPLHILLAEDNIINQKVALRILQRLGYRADVAANGLEVLQCLQRQHYDVVLMDVQMPEMDGLETTRLLVQQWPSERRPWIIAMTAHALEGDRERCLEAGMDDYISKPIRIEELMSTLAKYGPKAPYTPSSFL